jgi:hypothetical protein
LHQFRVIHSDVAELISVEDDRSVDGVHDFIL